LRNDILKRKAQGEQIIRRARIRFGAEGIAAAQGTTLSKLA
jgi:hypothetical protein